jgi:hypothetical protein
MSNHIVAVEARTPALEEIFVAYMQGNADEVVEAAASFEYATTTDI